MEISKAAWNNYIQKLSRIDRLASETVLEYIQNYENHFGENFEYTKDQMKELVNYAYSVSNRYGEAAASLSCEMYDAIAEASGKMVEAAVPAETAPYSDVAKAVYGTGKYKNENLVSNSVGRLVKRAGADTMLNNSLRDGAQFAWVPNGDTCAFCIALASRGWQYVSKKTLKNGHAEHIHANCDCTYAIRFNPNTQVAGYNPKVYEDMYYGAEGRSPEAKLNWLRNMLDAKNRDKINAQKRINYDRKRLQELLQHKDGDKVKITDQAITKVKAIGPSSSTNTEIELMKELNKQILTISRDSNNSNEVAMAISNEKISKPVLGKQNKVNVYEDPDMYHILRGSDAKMRSVILSHNHPGLSYFSVGDLEIFAENPSIKTMEIVTNQGKVWYISKKDNYDDIEAHSTLKSLIRENKEGGEKVVEVFLESIYNMIERNR